jgi:hypothetical protein
MKMDAPGTRNRERQADTYPQSLGTPVQLCQNTSSRYVTESAEIQGLKNLPG